MGVSRALGRCLKRMELGLFKGFSGCKDAIWHMAAKALGLALFRTCAKF